MLSGKTFLEIGVPCAEVVDPGLDGVVPHARLVDEKRCGPQVVGERCYRCRAPRSVLFVPKEHSSGDMIVPIAKDGCGHGNSVTHYPFCGIAATVNLWFDVFNQYALATFNRFHSAQFQKFVLYFVSTGDGLYASYLLDG
jgi:hypothetical protein